MDLDLKPGEVCLVIGGDGRGFDSSTVGTAHLGLKSMRGRAVLAAAELHVASTSSGTVVRLGWPASPSPDSLAADFLPA